MKLTKYQREMLLSLPWPGKSWKMTSTPAETTACRRLVKLGLAYEPQAWCFCQSPRGEQVAAMYAKEIGK